MAAFGVSIRRACRALRFNLSTYFYCHRRPDQAPLRMRLRELAATRVRYGYLRLHVLLSREGWQVNHKRIYRLYKLEGLSLRLKTPKKRLSRQRVEGPPATAERVLEHGLHLRQARERAQLPGLNVSR